MKTTTYLLVTLITTVFSIPLGISMLLVGVGICLKDSFVDMIKSKI